MRSWLEISLWKAEKGRKKRKRSKEEARKEERWVSKQPSSTAEIR
jgi:hypothetical protein